MSSSLGENAIVLLDTIAIADLSGVAQTTLYTVPAGKRLILTEVWLISNRLCQEDLDTQF